MNERKTLWVWVGVVVVIIVAIWGTLYWFAHRAQAPATQPIGVPVRAPQGQVVSGFPEKFLLGFVSADANAAATGTAAGQVTDSYSIHYSSTSNQYTAEWMSSSTVATLFGEYRTYVLSKGWTIANQANFPTLKGLYATYASSSASVNIVITTDAATKGSKITITYVDNVK